MICCYQNTYLLYSFCWKWFFVRTSIYGSTVCLPETALCSRITRMESNLTFISAVRHTVCPSLVTMNMMIPLFPAFAWIGTSSWSTTVERCVLCTYMWVVAVVSHVFSCNIVSEKLFVGSCNVVSESNFSSQLKNCEVVNLPLSKGSNQCRSCPISGFLWWLPHHYFTISVDTWHISWNSYLLKAPVKEKEEEDEESSNMHFLLWKQHKPLILLEHLQRFLTKSSPTVYSVLFKFPNNTFLTSKRPVRCNGFFFLIPNGDDHILLHHWDTLSLVISWNHEQFRNHNIF